VVLRRPHVLLLRQIANLPVEEGSEVFHDKLMRAMDFDHLQSKPGDVFETAVWEVDYRACGEAYKLAQLHSAESIEEDAWKMSVWTRHGAKHEASWVVIEVWKTYDPARKERRLEIIKVRILFPRIHVPLEVSFRGRAGNTK